MAALPAAVAVLAAGCTGDPAEDAGTPPGSISIGIAEPASLIPSDTVEANGSQVLASLFSPLVRFDEARKPVPVAAQSITKDRANRVWTIRLRPGSFANGEPVTADNYIDAWNYAAYGPNGQLASYLFSRIEGFADLQSLDPDAGGPQKAPEPKARTLAGLRKIDDNTFTVTLQAGFAGWASMIGYDAFYPLPKAAFRADGVLDPAFGEAPIGNGPFKMKGTWEHGSRIQVERVAGFAGTAPKVGAITWKIYKDPSAQYGDLTAGDLDVDTRIPVEKLAAARTELGGRLQQSPGSDFTFVGFPTYEADYKDARVRRALSMAIDRRDLTERIFLGAETPATSFVSPLVAGGRPDPCGEFCRHDPTRAKQLWTEAGGPQQITISYNTDGGHKPWVDAMCAQITGSLGVECTGRGEPSFADLLAKVRKREPVGLVRMAWTMDYPLMESFLGPLYGTDGASNHSGYSNTAFDSLVRQGAEAPTNEAAVKFWRAAEDILVQDMPVLPLRFSRNVFGHSVRVTGVTMDVFSRVDVYRIAVAG